MKSRSYYLIAVILPCALPGLARAAAPSGWTIAGSAPAHYVFALEASSPVKQSKSALIAAKPGATRNGFGGYQRVTLYCDYDTQTQKVLGYRIAQ